MKDIVYKYASALFEVAKDNQILDDVTYDFQTFQGALKNNEEWLSVMQSTEIKKTKKRELIKNLSNFNNVFLNFLYALLDNNHLPQYYEIYDRFRTLSRKDKEIAHVRIITANPLTKEQYYVIREELYGWIMDKQLETEIIIDKRLMGGIRIEYEGQTIDRTFYSQLQELKEMI